jgi:biofilm PGA synthesis N-glycosyltransferase PgaC
VMCNGANMGFRKSAYEAVGGYGPGSSTNDDEALMNRILERGLGRVAFASEPQAVVQTHSNNTPWTFFLQRMRWASKQGRNHDQAIMLTLVLVYVFFASAFAACIFAFWKSSILLLVIPVLAAKAIFEYRILLRHANATAMDFDLVLFCVAELLHVPYIAITAAAGQFFRARWKE